MNPWEMDWSKPQQPAAAPANKAPWEMDWSGNARTEAEGLLSKAQQRYAEEDAATKKANQDAPWYERLGTGIKTQTGRTMLGVAELANNLTGDALMDPEVLAEAQREADRRDAGTGVMGAVGNVAGDFRNWLPVGPAAQAAKAKTLTQAVKQGAKVGALSGALTGLTESTGDEDSTVLTNLGNTVIGGTAGTVLGGALPVAATGVKKGGQLVAGGANRLAAALGSDAAAQNVAYGNIARVLTGQGYTAGEVAGILDEFRAQGIDGGTLGQILQSSDLLAREKNLLQGGGKAGRVMQENLADQPRQIAASILRKVQEYAQPEQTAYLYRQAAELADTPIPPQPGAVVGMGRSATQQELPFTLNAIEDDLAARADELPPTVLKRIQKIIAAAKADGGFEAADTAKKKLADLYKENSTTTDQDIINEVADGYRRMLNDALEAAGGDTYTAAKTAAMRDMAMRDVEEAVRGAQGASVKTALNTFFGSPEKQEEFLRKVPEHLRPEFLAYLDNLQRVAGRFGGSDTASNTATQKVMNAETGFGFDANLVNPQTWVDRAAAPISRNVRKAQAEVTFAPDAGRLADAMQRGGPVNVPAAVPRVLATEAAKGAVPPGTPPEPVQPPEPQPVELQPQSDAAPLLQRFAQAESGGDPNAKSPNGTSSGLLGFTDDTWARSVARWGKELGVTLKDKNNPEAQMALGEKLNADNARILAKKLGREPSDGEQYAAWFLGPEDAAKLIRAQGSGREALLLFPRRVVNDNRAVFFQGKTPRTVEAVLEILTNKVS